MEHDTLFNATIYQIAYISSILNSISTICDQCTLTASEEGLLLELNDRGTVKVSVLFDTKLFSYFHYDSSNEGTTSFKINLTSLVETVNIITSEQRTKTRLSYAGYGEPFLIIIEDDLVLERIEFHTYEMDEFEELHEEAVRDDFEIDSSQVVFEIFLQSNLVYEILKDLRDLNTQELYLYGKKADKEELVFIAKNDLGYSKLFFPSSKSVLQQMRVNRPNADAGNDHLELESTTDSITSFYNFDHFAKFLKLLKISSKMKLYKDYKGLTCINLLVKNSGAPSHKGTIVEFKILELMSELNQDLNEQIDAAGSEISKIWYNNQDVQQLINDNDIDLIQLRFQQNFSRQNTIDQYMPNIDVQQSMMDSRPLTKRPRRGKRSAEVSLFLWWLLFCTVCAMGIWFDHCVKP